MNHDDRIFEYLSMSQVNNTPILIEKDRTKSTYTDRIILTHCVRATFFSLNIQFPSQFV